MLTRPAGFGQKQPSNRWKIWPYLRFLMFKLFKQKPIRKDEKLFRMTLHVGRGTNTEMPSNLAGAYVPVFVGASDHEAAALKAVSALRSRGFDFIDIVGCKIHELDPESWDAFVKDAWPEFILQFPVQATVIDALKTDFIFFGPFASYETKAAGHL
jgi:hypothetical protein